MYFLSTWVDFGFVGLVDWDDFVVDLEVVLEFFWVDGECVGIGASDYSDRKKFPLIQDFDE